MGYYENPPMVESDRSGLIIADSISRSAESIAKGLMLAGDRKRREEEERKQKIQRLQDKKNETDLFYNDKLSEWNKSQTGVNPEFQNKTRSLIQEKITLAADSRIALLSETDPKIRQELLTNISNADRFLDNSAMFGKSIAGESLTWKTSASALKVGVPGGWAVNGRTDEEIEDNTAVLDISSGMSQLYTDVNMDVSTDDKGSILYRISGKHKNGRAFDVSINSDSYLASDSSGDGSLLLKVETLDDFKKESLNQIADEKGNIYEGYLGKATETVDLPSKGAEKYQLVNAQRLQSDMIRSRINEKSEVRAGGILANYKPASLRSFIDYTLGKGPGYYDKNFKGIIDPNVQKAELAKMITEDSFNTLTSKLDRTYDNNGNVTYWSPSSEKRIKPDQRQTTTTKPKEEKEQPWSYKQDYVNNLISGLDPSKKSKDPAKAAYEERVNIVENLNRMSGSSSFATRDELFNRWKKQPYKSGSYEPGTTIEEEYKTGKLKDKNIKDAFNNLYPYKNGYVYVEKSANMFVPVKGYNLNKAEDRVKLALDYTAEAGERKILQESLREARLKDWTSSHPRKSNETMEQYIARARKAGF
jgi:hypothetical protein